MGVTSSQDQEFGVPDEDAMRVILPDQWEPCSPEWLQKGGNCACAPRVWNEADKNHWHPKIDERKAGTMECRVELKLIDDHAPKVIGEFSDWLRTMACVHPETGERRMPTAVDDAVFDQAADFIENALKEIDSLRDTIAKATHSQP